MPFLEAFAVALQTIRVRTLKSVFSLLGVIRAVVSSVNGMARVAKQEFAGQFLGVNTFDLRRFGDVGEVWPLARHARGGPRVIRRSAAIQASVPSLAVVAAPAASALTSITFGLLPAVRAARPDPVEALRFS